MLTAKLRSKLRIYDCIAAVACFVLASSLSAQKTEVDGKDLLRQSSAAMDYTYVTFRGDIDPWRLASLSLSQRSSRGSIIGRLNWANRFSTSGIQLEADAYPRINSRMYAYLNAGYSASSIFPAWRFGGELFTSLPEAWEASIGFRQLRFSGPPVTLFTGAVGKYVGNYWISLRPYVRFTPTGTSASAGLTMRRYFEDGDHYFGGSVSYGSGPSDQSTPDAVARDNSFSVGIQGSKGISRATLFTWSGTRKRESFPVGFVRNSLSGTIGLKLIF